jgi:hypothetical protein
MSVVLWKSGKSFSNTCCTTVPPVEMLSFTFLSVVLHHSATVLHAMTVPADSPGVPRVWCMHQYVVHVPAGLDVTTLSATPQLEVRQISLERSQCENRSPCSR